MVNRTEDVWVHPWNVEKFDDLFNRDERFFAILMKGFLSWLNENIVMYNKPIMHFIVNTGSSYLYMENNGYQFNMSETSGEDMIYMQMPRCIIELGSISIPFEELTQAYSRGTYERRSGNDIKGYNAQLRRIPIEWSITAKYVLSNFNESIVLIQELIDKLSFQQYFQITYLGQVIECSFEIPSDFTIELNKIDMTATDVNQKTIDISIKICSNYPSIDDRTEISNGKIIANLGNELSIGETDTAEIQLNKEKETVETEKEHLEVVKPVSFEDIYDESGMLIKTEKYDELENKVGEALYNEEGDVTVEILYDRFGHEIAELTPEEYNQLNIDSKIFISKHEQINPNISNGRELISGTQSYKILSWQK